MGPGRACPTLCVPDAAPPEPIALPVPLLRISAEGGPTRKNISTYSLRLFLTLQKVATVTPRASHLAPRCAAPLCLRLEIGRRPDVFGAIRLNDGGSPEEGKAQLDIQSVPAPGHPNQAPGVRQLCKGKVGQSPNRGSTVKKPATNQGPTYRCRGRSLLAIAMSCCRTQNRPNQVRSRVAGEMRSAFNMRNTSDFTILKADDIWAESP